MAALSSNYNGGSTVKKTTTATPKTATVSPAVKTIQPIAASKPAQSSVTTVKKTTATPVAPKTTPVTTPVKNTAPSALPVSKPATLPNKPTNGAVNKQQLIKSVAAQQTGITPKTTTPVAPTTPTAPITPTAPVSTTPAATTTSAPTAPLAQTTPTPKNPATPVQTPDYMAEATGQYDVGYNANVDAINQALAAKINALNAKKTGINDTYDYSVDMQNLDNKKTKNNYSNTMLGRGLNRGTIVGTGLAEADVINGRRVGEINSDRASELNNVDTDIAQARTDNATTLARMQADRSTAIQNLARQLSNDAFSRNIQESQVTGMYGDKQTVQGRLADSQIKQADSSMRLNDAQVTGIGLDNQAKETNNATLGERNQLEIDSAKADIALKNKQAVGADISNQMAQLQLDNLPQQQQLEMKQLQATINQINSATDKNKADIASQALADQLTKINIEYLPQQLQEQIKNLAAETNATTAGIDIARQNAAANTVSANASKQNAETNAAELQLKKDAQSSGVNNVSAAAAEDYTDVYQMLRDDTAQINGKTLGSSEKVAYIQNIINAYKTSGNADKMQAATLMQTALNTWYRDLHKNGN